MIPNFLAYVAKSESIAEYWKIRIGRTLLRIVSTALLLLVMMASLASAECPKIQLKIIPDSLEFPAPGEEVRALVVVSNPTSNPGRNLRLTWWTTAKVQVKPPDPARIEVLSPNSIYVWDLRLSQEDAEPISDTIYFRVNFQGQAKEAAPQLEVAPLKVKSRELEGNDKVIDIQVKASLESLSSNRPGKIYLLIKNISNFPLRITPEIKPTLPEFIEPPQNLKMEKEIPPQQVLIWPIDIKVKGKVQPGKYQVLFNVPFVWKKGGYEYHRSLAVAQEVTVGIFGESEMLKALGVPSFLLLPGFLLLITMSFLWKRRIFRSEDDIAEFPLKPTDAEFWLVAITISVIMAFICTLNTRLDYLHGYDLSVIVYVWMISVGLGIVGYVIGMIGIRWYESRRTPSEIDQPLSLLEKLERRGLWVRLEKVSVKIDGADHNAFMLEAQLEGRQQIWVAPPMVVMWLQNFDPKIKQEFDNQFKPAGNMSTLIKVLQEGERLGSLRLFWQATGSLRGPHKAKAEDVAPLNQQDCIIEQDFE